MADGSGYLQQTIGPTFYQQHTPKPSLPTATSSIDVNNAPFLQSLLGQFIAPVTASTTPIPTHNSSLYSTSLLGPPSPSRSPDRQGSALSQTLQGMYSQNQHQGHNSRLNNNQPASRMHIQYGYQQPVQHHVHAQHHPGLQQEHSGQGVGAGVLGHHASYSGGVLPNASAFTANLNANISSALPNGHSGTPRGGEAEQISESWAEQLRMHKEAERAHATMIEQNSPHYYARLKAADNRVANSPSPANGSLASRGDNEETRRPLLVTSKASKQQNWTILDMSGQQIRSLSMNLFNYTFLQELYISSNKLSTLTPAIGELRQLRILEASNNQLTELPPEIGMCYFLKQLTVFNNHIHTLPLELGSLHNLEMLGIEGNPLDPEMKDMIKKHGTAHFIQDLLNKQPVPLPPQPRKSVVVQEDVSPSLERIKVLSWNILAEKPAHGSIGKDKKKTYGYTPPKALDWVHRRTDICNGLREWDADILCLQEVTGLAHLQLRKELVSQKYLGIYFPRPKLWMSNSSKDNVDGCAIFYRGTDWYPVSQTFINLQDIALTDPRLKGEHNFNRLQIKDNIATVGFLESLKTGARIIVVNAHLTWEGHMADVKLLQTAIIMEQVEKLASEFISKRSKDTAPMTIDQKREKIKDKIATKEKLIDLKKANMGTSAEEEAEVEFLSQELDTLTVALSRVAAPSQDWYRDPKDIPIFVCGDYNSTAESGVYELLSKGRIAYDHPELLNPEKIKEAHEDKAKSGSNGGGISGGGGGGAGGSEWPSTEELLFNYGTFMLGSSSSAAGPSSSSASGSGFKGREHPFSLRSAYQHLAGTPDEMPFTNYTPSFTDTIDYIWYSSNNLEVVELLGPPDLQHLKRVPGFPHYHFPSDHLPILADFVIKARKDRKGGDVGDRERGGGGRQ